MNKINALKSTKGKLDNLSKEYKEIVRAFERSVIVIDTMSEKQKNAIRMKALEARCKNSQYLLEDIIDCLESDQSGIEAVREYRNQASEVLTNIRAALNKNNLMKMIGHLEEIPAVMSKIDKGIILLIKQAGITMH